MGDHVYIKVNPKKSTLILGKCKKFTPRYYGSFEIIAKVGPVTYWLAPPPSIKVHNVFHVSIFKKYFHDVSHVIDWDVIQVEPEREFQVRPKCIPDMIELLLRNHTIRQVKEQWKQS